MRKVLFIAHYFPPLGGAGVQRSVKFVKYLQEFGLLPIVLTGDPHPGDFWSPMDASFAAEIPANVPIFRAAAGPADEPFDSRRRMRALCAAGAEAIEKHRPELIYVSLSPYEDARLAARLAGEHGLPWVADLRDPWAFDEFKVFRSRWHRRAQLRRMLSDLRTASLVIMNTPEAAAQLRAHLPAADHARVISLTNGFDAADFAGEAPRRDPEKFTLVHSGYLHTTGGLHQEAHPFEYQALGRTEPGVQLLSRSHFYLLRALEIWCREEPEVRKKLKLVLIGALSTSDRDLHAGSPVADLVKSMGYLPHADSIKWVRQADLLFLPMHSLPPGRRATIVPGKTYEYLASQRPILGALPPGDARDFIQQFAAGMVCDPTDVTAMLGHLRRQYAAWQSQQETAPVADPFVAQFERRRLTEELAAQFLRLLEGRQRAPVVEVADGALDVSVIIPTFNRCDTIARAVESVLAQTVAAREVIVIDDGSTDETAAVLARFGDRIRLLRQENAGPSAARNLGIRNAQSELIAFLDSDDCWLPAKLERQVAMFERHAGEGITCCVCNARMHHPDGTTLQSFSTAGLHPAAESGVWSNPFAVLATRFLLFNQVALVRREALDRSGLFNESLRLMEDYDLQLRLALTGPWAYLRETLVTWHGGAANSLSNAASESDAEEKAYAILKALHETHRLENHVAPAVLARRLWQLRARIAAEEKARRPEPLSRLEGELLRHALRLWQALYSRFPGYPRMITSP